MRVTEIINESKINTEFLDQWFTKNDEFVLEPGESPRRYKGYVKSRPDLEIVLYKEGGKTIGGQPITDRYSKEIVSWGGSYVSDDTYKIIKKKMNSSEEMKKVMESLDRMYSDEKYGKPDLQDRLDAFEQAYDNLQVALRQVNGDTLADEFMREMNSVWLLLESKLN